LRLLDGPVRIRLVVEGPEAASIAARATRDGFLLVSEDEEADLVAALPPTRPARGARWPAEGPRLSRRELEILEYLVDGWSNAEIASALGIGVRTVRFHLEGLYAKLGTTRRGEAVREGLRLGLVHFDS
jgi:DNA-binding CsgD family transcriptional regulator